MFALLLFLCCISLPRWSFIWRCSGWDHVLQDLKVGELIWRPKPVVVLFSLGKKLYDLSSLTGVQSNTLLGVQLLFTGGLELPSVASEDWMYRCSKATDFWLSLWLTGISSVPLLLCQRYYQLTAEVWIRSSCVGHVWLDVQFSCEMLFHRWLFLVASWHR